MKMHYVIKLWEPAAPSFCSFDKMYIGSKQDILSAALNMEHDDAESETAKAVRVYYGGNHEAKHNIAYKEIPVLKPVRVLASSKMTLQEKTWDHQNIWDCPYRMKFDSAEVEQIIVRYEGKYHRCIKAKIIGLCYKGINGEWAPVDMVFGNGCVLNSVLEPSGKMIFETLLYVQEDDSKDKESLIHKLNDPGEVVFDRICDEVFGDG